MKKYTENNTLSQEENTQLLFLAQKVLSIHSSGVYITGFDIAAMGKALGYDYPVHNREEMMVAFLIDVKKDNKITDAARLFTQLLSERSKSYTDYLASYPKASAMIQPWLLKSRHINALFVKELQGGPYDR